ncbi:MAG TPA: amidohydrolase, partial [Desulfobulbaceae bacterium]|nr:amidohydrolase [Desulfobulbaceae bacterium]
MTTTYILAGWLIDGSGGKVRERMLLRVEEGRFVAIEEYRPDCGVDTSQLTDLSHCTILPPLVDCHMHLFMSGTIDQRVREVQLTAGFEELQPVMARHLADLLSHGVLAARD